jgi:predicted ribosome quality control (RQC) complex YloA/Tae2 family protein
VPSQPLQPLDVTSLRAVVAELEPVLVPSRFTKAQQSDACTVQLGLRSLEGPQWLEISWLAEAPRLLAIEPPPRLGDGSTLAQQLQHGLRGLALVAIEQQGWERVVRLRFAERPGAPPQRELVMELMGRHSNLFLLDGEGRVVALGHQVRQGQSRLRPIGTGDPYQPPPPLRGDRPRSQEPQARWQERLSLLPLPLGRALAETYQGMSPALIRQLLGDTAAESAAWLERPVQELGEPDWQRLWQRWWAWLAAVEQGQFHFEAGGPTAYRCWQAHPPEASQAPQGIHGRNSQPLPLNRQLAAYYRSTLTARELERRRQRLEQQLHGAVLRESEQLRRQEELLAAAAGSEELQSRADELLSRFGLERAEVEEAQKLYRRARKLRRSVGAITPRLEEHRSRLAWLEHSRTFLEQADSAEELAALEEELAEGLAGRPAAGRREWRRSAAAAAEPQPLELTTHAGLAVQVGRNHRQNEWISLRQARRGDLWFHAQECPGSHVVLKASRSVAGEADLQAAADLAAHFSRARGNSRVPVVMVPAEELQRIPGSAPGIVRHRGGVVLWGEPERAGALLERPSLGREPAR